MTQPRLIVPGETVMITVRTIARFYLLRPDAPLVAAIEYLLAHYAERHYITLHAVTVMSTHMHIVLFDREGARSDFMRDVHRGVANVVKAFRKWRGPVFRPKPNVVRLLTKQAIVDKIAYVLANPVAAGAVKRVAEWPGICAAGGVRGARARDVQRPEYFYSSRGRLPEVARFELLVPEVLLASYGSEGVKSMLKEALARHLRRGEEEVIARGWKVRGPQFCLKTSPFKRAHAYEVFGALVPTFAVLGGGMPSYRKAVRQLRLFRRRYRDAFERWRRGERNVCFPLGTWRMRVLHDVRCAAW